MQITRPFKTVTELKTLVLAFATLFGIDPEATPGYPELTPAQVLQRVLHGRYLAIIPATLRDGTPSAEDHSTRLHDIVFFRAPADVLEVGSVFVTAELHDHEVARFRIGGDDTPHGWLATFTI